MNSTSSKSLFCDICINSKLADLKRQKDLQDREARIKAEQAQIEHARRLAQIEQESYLSHRKLMQEEAQSTAKALYSKTKPSREQDSFSNFSNSNNDYLQEFHESRRRYREDLLGQIKEKQENKAKSEREIKTEELRRLRQVEEEKERSIRELTAESLIQKEKYRHSLEQQINLKQSRRNEELYQKKVEKAILDEEVRRFQTEQRHLVSLMKHGEINSPTSPSHCCDSVDNYGTCSNCNRLLPAYALSKFPN
jgi:hypothetical protein